MLAAALIWGLGRALDVVSAANGRVVLWLLIAVALVAAAIAGFVFLARRRHLPVVGESIPITVEPELVNEMLSDLTPKEKAAITSFQEDPIGAGWERHKEYTDIITSAGQRWAKGRQRKP